jgi:hypothetical protein
MDILVLGFQQSRNFWSPDSRHVTVADFALAEPGCLRLRFRRPHLGVRPKKISLDILNYPKIS